ncbi:hypothetical protein CVT25_001715, partial [Psilocybe cyanescens]
ASGVGVNDQCLSTFQDLKLKKKFKYIIFNLNKDITEIVVEKTSEDADYDVFLADLPETECRWAIYDFEFEKEGAGKRNKIIFISWSPDDAKIKQKMVFASSRDALKRSLNGIAVEIQGTDFGEVAFESGEYFSFRFVVPNRIIPSHLGLCSYIFTVTFATITVAFSFYALLILISY